MQSMFGVFDTQRMWSSRVDSLFLTSLVRCKQSIGLSTRHCMVTNLQFFINEKNAEKTFQFDKKVPQLRMSKTNASFNRDT